MKKVVVDTSVLIDHLRQKDKKATLFEILVSDKNLKLLIPGIVTGELFSGKSCARKEEEKRVRQVLTKGKIVLPNRKTYELGGKIFRETKGIVLSDALIVATAIQMKAPLATLDLRHFEDIPALELFDWQGLKMSEKK